MRMICARTSNFPDVDNINLYLPNINKSSFAGLLIRRVASNSPASPNRNNSSIAGWLIRRVASNSLASPIRNKSSIAGGRLIPTQW